MNHYQKHAHDRAAAIRRMKLLLALLDQLSGSPDREEDASEIASEINLLRVKYSL